LIDRMMIMLGHESQITWSQKIVAILLFGVTKVFHGQLNSLVNSILKSIVFATSLVSLIINKCESVWGFLTKKDTNANIIAAQLRGDYKSILVQS